MNSRGRATRAGCADASGYRRAKLTSPVPFSRVLKIGDLREMHVVGPSTDPATACCGSCCPSSFTNEKSSRCSLKQRQIKLGRVRHGASLELAPLPARGNFHAWTAWSIGVKGALHYDLTDDNLRAVGVVLRLAADSRCKRDRPGARPQPGRRHGRPRRRRESLTSWHCGPKRRRQVWKHPDRRAHAPVLLDQGTIRPVSASGARERAALDSDDRAGPLRAYRRAGGPEVDCTSPVTQSTRESDLEKH